MIYCYIIKKEGFKIMNDDNKLKLNDILHLTKNQIANTKIGLNMGW